MPERTPRTVGPWFGLLLFLWTTLGDVRENYLIDPTSVLALVSFREAVSSDQPEPRATSAALPPVSKVPERNAARNISGEAWPRRPGPKRPDFPFLAEVFPRASDGLPDVSTRTARDIAAMASAAFTRPSHRPNAPIEPAFAKSDVALMAPAAHA